MPTLFGEPQAASCLVLLPTEGPGCASGTRSVPPPLLRSLPGLSLTFCSQDLTPAQVPWETGDRAAPYPLLSGGGQ